MKSNAVVILCSGKGTRLGSLTENLNKSLVPIGNKSTIGYILEKIPKGTDIYLTLGFQGEQVRNFCELTYADQYRFHYIPVLNFEGPGSGPGTSLQCCEQVLGNRPFYIVCCDCVVLEDFYTKEDSENWIGVQKTDKPQLYSTADVLDGIVVGFKNKCEKGYSNAFIGLAHIATPEIFWKELRQRKVNGEFVEAFKGYEKLSLKAKNFTWNDTGNLQSFEKVKKTLETKKTLGEKLYVEAGKVLKFFPEKEKAFVLEKASRRFLQLGPENVRSAGNFLVYDWIEGQDLYREDESVWEKLLGVVFSSYSKSKCSIPENSCLSFYRDKTLARVHSFVGRYGEKYLKESFTVNGVQYSPLESMLGCIDFGLFYRHCLGYTMFHGDLQPSNVILSNQGRLVYIDWRDLFDKYSDRGDLYYDLGKMLGGIEINYSDARDSSIFRFKESDYNVEYRYSYEKGENFLPTFYNILQEHGVDRHHVELVRILVQLSMTPLHEEQYGKFLWFRSIENLSKWIQRKRLLQ